MSLLKWLRSIVRRTLLPLGICFVVLAVALAGHSEWLLHADLRAPGKIVSLQERVDEDGDTNYFPAFTFLTPDGREHTVQSNTGGSPSPFVIGEDVVVLYDRRNPEKAEIDAFSQLWLIPLIFGPIGCVLATLGVFLTRGARRRLAQGPRLHPSIRRVESA